jgi:hypothetical protein
MRTVISLVIAVPLIALLAVLGKWGRARQRAKQSTLAAVTALEHGLQHDESGLADDVLDGFVLGQRGSLGHVLRDPRRPQDLFGFVITPTTSSSGANHPLVAAMTTLPRGSPWLRLRHQGRLGSLGRQDVATGDEAFDRAWLVQTDLGPDIVRFLDEPMRQWLCSLPRGVYGPQFEIINDRLLVIAHARGEGIDEVPGFIDVARTFGEQLGRR